MAFKILELPEQCSNLVFGTTGIVVISVAIVLIARSSWYSNLDAFPTVGSDGLLGSWMAGLKFFENGIDVIQEGYEKHKSAPFKVMDQYGWMVVLSNRKHLEEIRTASEDDLSLMEATNDRLNTRYTLGDELHDTAPHQMTVIRSQLARNTGTMYPEIRDEVITAFEDVLDFKGTEWKAIPALGVMQQIICRSTNRFLVGLPLCRDQDWIDLNIQHAVNMVKTGLTIGLFPKFIRPLAARYFTAVARDAMHCEKHIGPIIEERLKLWSEGGDKWAEKPNDLISWLIEAAVGSQPTVKSLATRMLVVNFPAITTTSGSFTSALFYLAANPQYIQPLREEVEAIIDREGWTKYAVSKMHKIDSFLKECERLEGGSADQPASVARKARKDYTFSDGTFIPKGTMVVVATRCIHYDEEFYENAREFDPFRFVKLQEKDGRRTGRYRFASTAIEYQPFGHGIHACPGRFLAASIMKTMLAHIVTTYDVRLEDGATRPRGQRFGILISVDPSAKVVFRARVE